MGTPQDRKYIDNWLRELNLRFNACPPPGPNDLERITYAAARLKGPAADWYRGTEALYTTWVEFREAFLHKFSLHNQHERAWDRLMQLRQERTVQHYITSFTNLTLQVPDLSPDRIKMIFVNGLKPAIRVQAEINRDQLDLEALMILADRLETIQLKQRDLAQHIARPHPTFHGRPGMGTQAPMPMELGAMRNDQPRPHVRFAPNGRRPEGGYGKLSDKEREYLLANNGCTFCRRLGHTIQNCTARPTNAAHPRIQQGNGYGRGK